MGLESLREDVRRLKFSMTILDGTVKIKSGCFIVKAHSIDYVILWITSWTRYFTVFAVKPICTFTGIIIDQAWTRSTIFTWIIGTQIYFALLARVARWALANIPSCNVHQTGCTILTRTFATNSDASHFLNVGLQKIDVFRVLLYQHLEFQLNFALFPISTYLNDR